ncbi:ABC transporter permease [Nocardioides currus]|uniref:Autoinducer 2 import system permease protein LsrD n=1 Tax=Nocardioides currus TaxID=2133958 RepID=A0A2R7YSZ6_9ACTN|nr:ABC transporter permease [Nocardioides currus]PUA79521.1 ABC transporter permease [Nocardioides currus]
MTISDSATAVSHPEPASDVTSSGTPADPGSGAAVPGVSRAQRLLRTVSARYALLVVWAIIVAVYGVLMPSTFLSTSTLQAILGSQSVMVFLALAALCTFVVGEFDLSFASVMGLSATTVPVLTTLHGVPIWMSCVAALGAALACGVLNAFFVVVMEVPSLIVTLGSASLFLGLATLVGSSTIVSVSDQDFSDLARHTVVGLPLSFYYGLLASVLFAYVLAWTPLGRHIIFVGANRDVARLAGINVARIRAGSYVAGGLLAGLAGILLVATVGGVDPTGSSVYLLPALAAVFLGTAVVQPGQFNPMGTFLGIFFLATGVIGLQLLGYTGWVQDVFYGVGLIVAVTAAAIVRKKVRSS